MNSCNDPHCTAPARLAGRIFLSLAIAATALCANGAELVIAQVSPFTGPLGSNGTANYAGSKACVDEANDKGGVQGNTLRLVKEDDQYKADETVRLVKQVAERDRPIAFINLLGSINVGAMQKQRLLDELRIPAIGITPAADMLRDPGSPWMFHLTASDTAQFRRILSHLSTIGLTRIAVAFQDNPFGRGGIKFVDAMAEAMKITVVDRVVVPLGADDITAQAAQLRLSRAQAYVMILAPNSGASFVRDVRKGGDHTIIYGMSYVTVTDIVAKAGAQNATGVNLAQVTPNTFASASGLVRRFHAAMDRFAEPGTAHTQLHLIGYLSCSAVVEGLRKAGPKPTPQKLQAKLREVHTDLGGFTLDFAGNNVGSKYVDIGLVTSEGKLMY